MPDLSQIFDSINEGLVVLDRNMRVLHWNPWMARHSGILAETISGHTIFDHFPTLDSPKFHRSRRAVLAFGNYAFFSQRLHQYLFPFPLRGPSAAWYPTMQQSCSMGPVREEGAIMGVYILVQDVTERLVLDRMKNEFVSMVTHELRTPLTSLRGSLGLLGSGALGALSPEAKEVLDIASRNGERLSNLINDLLDSEKLESGKMSLLMEPHALRPLLEQSLADNRGYAEVHAVTFGLGDVAPEIEVEVDRGRFFQIMSNLLSNAAKHSPEGGRVEVAVADEEEFVRISVADQGAGMPAEFIGRVFEKFSQAESPANLRKGGTGLGLSITKTLVEKMGGSIGFRSQLGKGTTFDFTLRQVLTAERPEA
ncbi:MAG: PAS domain-containing sensor histidine kinase [Acidobacteria bacterium]|nr:PAS domain-containing sensor histidine kinase [Acidobacteriota bacterium]